MRNRRANILAIFFALLLFCAGLARAVVLNFADGMLPSAHGWTFQGADQFNQPLTESQAASVSGGILHLNTVPFGGIGSNATLAYWSMPLPNVDPDNYLYEIRTRAIDPNSTRSCFGGLLGAGILFQGSYSSDITVMQPQATVTNMSSGNATCVLHSLDASVFHTYALEVHNGNQAVFSVDGVQIASGLLTAPNALSTFASFGDLSTSGGNVTADIEFIRIETVPEPVTGLLLGTGIAAILIGRRARYSLMPARASPSH